jgi:hypothetical protein
MRMSTVLPLGLGLTFGVMAWAAPTDDGKGDDPKSEEEGDEKAEDVEKVEEDGVEAAEEGAEAEPAAEPGADEEDPNQVSRGGEDDADPNQVSRDGDDSADPNQVARDGDDAETEDAEEPEASGDDEAEAAEEPASGEDAEGEEPRAEDGEDEAKAEGVTPESETAEAPAAAAGPVVDRDVVVLSDLHMGLGKTADGQWDPREDFRWTWALSSFFDHLAADDKPVDLVINGGLLNLWEVPDGIDCMGADCSEEQAVAIAEQIVAAHALDLQVIGHFSRRNGNVVYVVPGVQDAGLVHDAVWETVQAALVTDLDVEALADLGPQPEEPEEPEELEPAEGEEGEAEEPADEQDLLDTDEDELLAEEARKAEEAAAEAVELAKIGPPLIFRVNGSWANADGRIVVEPGGTFASDPVAAQTVFNAVEGDSPLVDNLRPMAKGAVQTLGDGSEDPDAATSLIHDYALITAPTVRNKRLTDRFGHDSEPKWNLKKARKRGYLLYVDALHPDDRVRPNLLNGNGEWTALRKSLNKAASQASDMELTAFCDRIAIYNGLYGERGVYPRCDGYNGKTTRIAAGRAQWFGEYLDEKAPRASIYVYGSTHQPEVWNVDLPNAGRSIEVYNTGAFQRLLDDTTHRELAARMTGGQAQDLTPAELQGALSGLDLRHLPACYGAMVITVEDEEPEPALKHWYMPKGAEQGELLDLCDRTCGWVSESCQGRMR